MEFMPCSQCVGPRQEICIAARQAAQLGIEQTTALELDPDLRAMATSDIARRIARRIVENGCAYTATEIQRQIIQE
jgi:hypothetical protein